MNRTRQPMDRVLAADELMAGTEGRQRRRIALGKVDLLVTVVGLVFLAGAYWINFLPEAAAVLVVTVALLTVAARWRQGPARCCGLGCNGVRSCTHCWTVWPTSA
jgi:hypothetical protein